MHIFKEVLFVKLRTTEEQTINLNVSIGCGRLAEGKGPCYFADCSSVPVRVVEGLRVTGKVTFPI